MPNHTPFFLKEVAKDAGVRRKSKRRTCSLCKAKTFFWVRGPSYDPKIYCVACEEELSS